MQRHAPDSDNRKDGDEHQSTAPDDLIQALARLAAAMGIAPSKVIREEPPEYWWLK